MYWLYHCQTQRQQMGLVPHKCWDSQGSQGSQGMLCWRSSGTNLKSAKMVKKWSSLTHFVPFLYGHPARFMAHQLVTPVTPGMHIHCSMGPSCSLMMLDEKMKRPTTSYNYYHSASNIIFQLITTHSSLIMNNPKKNTGSADLSILRFLKQRDWITEIPNVSENNGCTPYHASFIGQKHSTIAFWVPGSQSSLTST